MNNDQQTRSREAGRAAGRNGHARTTDGSGAAAGRARRGDRSGDGDARAAAGRTHRSTIASPTGSTSFRCEDGKLSLTEGVELLETVGQRLADLNHLYADLIVDVGRLARGRVVEPLEGMTLDRFLSVAHRMTGGDVWLLETAARVLEAMPVTWCWFREGRISWSQLRHIVTSARDLSREHRQILDRRIRASGHLLDGAGAEAFLEAVDVAVDELHGRQTVERREQREARDSFLTVQPRLFGGISLYGEFDTTAGATIVNALDAASASAAKNTEAPGRPTTRAKQRAQGLVELSKAFLGGTTASGKTRKAKPQLLVHVPLDRVVTTAAGRVELNLPGAGLPGITARTLEALNEDADLRAVLFDGARPLAVSDKISACDIPAKTRLAVRARDRGCRFPGSRSPAGHCDIDHHTVPQRTGGGHHPDGLMMVSRRPHRWREDHNWDTSLDADTGAIVWRRSGRRWLSWPHGTQLADDPGPDDGPDEGEGRDPPVPF